MEGVTVPKETAKLSFDRYIGIDYSGAKKPTASLKGLRVYMADRRTSPVEIQPPPSHRKYWTRSGIAAWLRDQLSAPGRLIVGIDHGFSFPRQYFETHQIPLDWDAFLRDFYSHWPTDGDETWVRSLRPGNPRSGDTSWRRLTEERAGSAKSVFRFGVHGEVASSTHAGLPWLLYLRRHAAGRVHFWPFDGWEIPAGKSAVVEVYPALWKGSFPRGDRTGDQHDAYSVAAWMRRTDLDGHLPSFLNPALPVEDRKTAAYEGWILGIG